MHVVTIIMITIVNNKGGDSHYSWGHVHATRRRRLERLIGCPRGLNWDSSWSRSRIFPRELFDWPTSAATIVFTHFWRELLQCRNHSGFDGSVCVINLPGRWRTGNGDQRGVNGSLKFLSKLSTAVPKSTPKGTQAKVTKTRATER
jgi:hypothetical protein